MSAGPFKCQFSAGRTILHTKANRTSSNTVTCETPPPNTIPQFPVDQGKKPRVAASKCTIIDI